MGKAKDIHGGNIWEAARRAGAAPGALLDFSASINPLGPARGALRAVKEAAAFIPPYPDPEASALRGALASFHGIPERSVLPANGSTELIYAAARLFRPGKALVVEPAFSEYRKALKLAGFRAEGLSARPEEGFRLEMGRLARRLERGGYTLLFMANPANPTGSLCSRQEALEVVRLCRANGAAAVIDEAFIDFTGESIAREAASMGGAIVLRSMTKYYAMAGLRLGYAVAGGRLISGLRRLLPPWSVNTLASAAGEASLADAGYRQRSAAWLARERESLSSGLASVAALAPFPSSANYIMVRVEAPGLCAAGVASALLREGILIRDLSGFKGLGPEYFRVAVLGREANARLVSALRRLLGRKEARAAGRKASSARP